MPPARYIVFSLLLAGALGAASGALAPAPRAVGASGRLRRALSAAAMAAALVCIDAGLRYVRGSWPALWPPATSDRLLLYSLILFTACAAGALAPGGRAALLAAELAGFLACVFILLAPLKREWSAGGLALIATGWAALGVAAALSSHALTRSLSRPVGAASLTALPFVAALILFQWGHDATQSMTAGGLLAIALGFLGVAGLRRLHVSDAWATPIWWGALTLALASASHYASLAPAAGAALLSAPTLAALAALPVRRRSGAIRAALGGAGLGAALATAVILAIFAGSGGGAYAS